jgi:hypothetical protein
MLVQLPREVHIETVRDCWPQKNTDGLWGTMVGEMDIPKKGAVRLQQCKASSKEKEGQMTSKMEEE